MHREDYLNDSFIRAMREKYYNPKKMMHIKEHLRSDNIAILGIDLQNFFLNPKFKAYLPSSKFLIDKLIDFYSWSINRKIKIILTQHHHEFPDHMAKWWNDEMKNNSEKTRILKEIEKYGDIIVEKSTYDAFYNTELDNILKENRIKVLIITGVMTHLCCETTARSAFVRGYDVIFPIDGTATQSSHLHECTLRSISHGFAPTPSLRDVIEWMSQY